MNISLHHLQRAIALIILSASVQTGVHASLSVSPFTSHQTAQVPAKQAKLLKDLLIRNQGLLGNPEAIESLDLSGIKESYLSHLAAYLEIVVKNSDDINALEQALIRKMTAHHRSSESPLGALLVAIRIELTPETKARLSYSFFASQKKLKDKRNRFNYIKTELNRLNGQESICDQTHLAIWMNEIISLFEKSYEKEIEQEDLTKKKQLKLARTADLRLLQKVVSSAAALTIE